MVICSRVLRLAERPHIVDHISMSHLLCLFAEADSFLSSKVGLVQHVAAAKQDEAGRGTSNDQWRCVLSFYL